MNYKEAINLLEKQIAEFQSVHVKLAEYPGTDNDRRQIEEAIALQRAIIELATLSDMYQQDLREVIVPDLLSGAHRDSRRRQYFIAVFSWIEALNFQLRRIALAAQGGYINAHFEPAEIMLLREERYSFDEEHGRAVVKPNQFLKLLPNTRFTFRMFAKAYGSSWQLQVGTHYWQDFQAAYGIRNSLVHPKSSKSLTVSDSQVEKLTRAAKWYGEQLDSMVAEARRIVIANAEEKSRQHKENLKRFVEHSGAIYREIEAVNRASAIIDDQLTKAEPGEEVLGQWRLTRMVLEELKTRLLAQIPQRLGPPSLD